MDEPDQEADQAEASSTRSSWKWMKRFGLVVALVAILPTAISFTGTGARVLSWLHPELARVTRFERLHLHWWAPVECHGLQISNTREWAKDAPPLLTVERFTTNRPLWQIALAPGRNVEASFVSPELTLIESSVHSNLTDAMEDLSGARDSGSTTFPCHITVEHGRVSVARHPKGKSAFTDTQPTTNSYVIDTLISGIECSVSTLNTAATFPEISLVAAIGNHDEAERTAGGRVAVGRSSMNPRVAARLDDLAADYAPIQLEDPGNDERDITPTVALRMESIGDSDRHSLRFQASDVELEMLRPLLAQFNPGVRCKGRLSLRGEGMMLGDKPSAGMAFRFAMKGTDILWQQPSWDRSEALDVSSLTAECGLAIAEDGIVVQNMTANCPFARLTGNGEIRLPTERLLRTILSQTKDGDSNRLQVISEAQAAAAGQISIDGSLDLVAVAEMLPKTLRLREGLRLQQGTAKFAVRTRTQPSTEPNSDPLTWQAILETSPIVAQHNGRTLKWDDPIRLNSSGPLSLSTASLSQATFSGDFGRITATPASADTVSVRGNVNIDQFWGLLGQFVNLEAPGIQGNVEVAAHIGWPTTDELHLRGVKLQADNLLVETPAVALHMNQPLLSMLEGQLLCRGTGAAVQGLLAPWLDCSFLARESHVAVQMDAAPPERLTVVAEVKPGSTASRSRGAAVAATGSLNQARLALDIDTDAEPGHYVIRRGRFRIPGFQADLNGTMQSTGNWMTTNLIIDAEYDLASVSDILSDGFGTTVSLTGRKRSQFAIQGAPIAWDGNGPAAAEPFQVSGELAWGSANLDGIQLGPATAVFQLNQGRLQTEPIRCSANGGQLHAMINYDLRTNELALGTGSRVENVTLTHEMCSKWMGYVTPLMSDAASVNGTISARVQRFRYLMDAPYGSDMKGTVQIHSVTASPGRSLTQLLQAVDVLRPDRRSVIRDITLPEQTIQCELRNGVITHDQVLLALSGYQLRTRGSVGLDQRINITLDIPLERSDDLRGGRMVSVPVTGTIRNPSINLGRLLQDAGSQRIQSEIDEQLGRGINRLFDKLR